MNEHDEVLFNDEPLVSPAVRAALDAANGETVEMPRAWLQQIAAVLGGPTVVMRRCDFDRFIMAQRQAARAMEHAARVVAAIEREWAGPDATTEREPAALITPDKEGMNQ